MKILIIHLSDLHAKGNNTWNKDRQQKLVESLNEFRGKVEGCLIIFSGDIAYSGLEEQYCYASNALDNIRIQVSRKFNIKEIPIFVVPGNHDVDYKKINRDGKEILKQIQEREGMIDFIEEELKAEESFFRFAKKIKSPWQDKQFCSIYIKQYNLKINLINTAIFSMLETDKGYHYFPKEYFKKLFISEKQSKKAIVISIMHHHPEWMHEDIKLEFEENILESTSILILGHEHKMSTKSLTWDKKGKLVIIAGGTLHGNTDEESSYNLILLDNSSNKLKTTMLQWENKHHMYVPVHKQENTWEYKYCSRKNIKPNIHYLNYLLEDNKQTWLGNSFLEYFTFPRLEKIELSKEKEICDWNTFEYCIKECSFITIYGDENSGKTTLIKYSAYNLLKSNYVLFFEADDIKGKHIDKIVKEIFEEQYSEDIYDYTYFLQQDNEEKIAIIDDAHKIKLPILEKFLHLLKEKFAHIIIVLNGNNEFDISQKVKSIVLNDVFSEYKITPFFPDKREELIGKVFDLFNINSDNSKKEETIRSIDKFIKNQLDIFKINLGFLMQYLCAYIKRHDDLLNKQNIFSSIFESNIIQSIENNKQTENTQIILKILEEIAIYVHKNKSYPFSYDEADFVIQNYNKEYEFSVNTSKILRILREGKILKKVDEEKPSYYFSDNNYLAYFIAKKLHNMYNDDSSNNELTIILEDLIKNICLGVNSEIILFLSYITGSIKILQLLIEIADNVIKDWGILDLNDVNIPFLKRYKERLLTSSPSIEESKEIEKAEMHYEQIQQNKIIQTSELYDTDNHKQNTPIAISMKYMEIIARILPAFAYNLKKEIKQDLVNKIYIFPNKILYQFLNATNEEFDKLVSELVKEINSYSDKKVDRSYIEKLIYQICLVMIIAIYERVMGLATDKDTLQTLNKNCPKDNFTYDIQNLIIEDVMGNISEFNKKIDVIKNKVQPNKRNPMIINNWTVYNMLLFITRKFLLTHKKLPSSQAQALMDKFFIQNSNKSNLLLQKIKMKKK